MKTKKKTSKNVMKIGLSTCALISSVGIGVSNMIPLSNFTSVEASTALENKQVVNLETAWKYLDNNADPANGDASKATQWTTKGYDDHSWKSDKGKFGAKKGEIADLGGGVTPTVLLKQYYVDKKDIPTYFFRTTFDVEHMDQMKSLIGTLKADDGVIVYINGKKITEANMTNNGMVAEPNMYYAGTNGGSPANLEINVSIDDLKDVLVEGQNVLAVELHNDREASSDIYFEMSDLSIVYNEEDTIQKAISLTVGSDESQNNLTWYANTSELGEVQVAKKTELVNGEFPSTCRSIVATSKQTADVGFYSNQATIDKLEETTTYVYRVINGDVVSQQYEFTTGDFDGSFSFLLAGDPQIGSSGSIETDTKNWSDTVSKASTQFAPNFLISAGDQVNVATSENEYAGYLNSDVLKSLPYATTIGNHDSKSNAYQDHFNLPNEDSTKGVTTAGGDYWYVYNNTLFMDINTNNKSVADHKAFMQEAIAKNKDVRWKTVVFHHSVYSTADHTNDNEIVSLRNALPPIFSELDIDVVLQGHDHVYTRTYMMDGLVPDSSKGVQSSVVDPTGVLYLTANSASGSKYYDIEAPDAAFAAKMDQSRRRTITDVNVTDNTYTLTTYFIDDMSVLDTFTIHKTAVLNDKEEVLLPSENSNTSVDVSVKLPAESIETNASLNVNEITTGDVYNSVHDAIKQLLGSIKEFKFISLNVMKDNMVLELHNEAQLTFQIPTGYSAKDIQVYRYNTTKSKAIMDEISYEIKDNTIVVKVDTLGDFVIVNNKVASSDSNNQTPTTPDNTGKEETSNDTTDTSTKDEIAKITPTNKVNTGDTTRFTQLFVTAMLGIVAVIIAIKKKRNIKE